jgi:hypothetical protein
MYHIGSPRYCDIALYEAHITVYIPVVPHNAVAEVLKIGHARRGELL